VAPQLSSLKPGDTGGIVTISGLTRDIDTVVSRTETVLDTGILGVSFSTVAASETGSSAEADLGHTFRLASVTVADDLAAETAGLSLAFDNGLVLPITAESPVATSEPATLAVLCAGLLALGAGRRYKRR
jgi:hypothetical protein